ncbi:MAG: polysaccharide deacetylase family protein [Fibrobacter sp.]|nr:polysaccharide deacetylase family protein [Fibrobacter sp.]
MEKRIIAATTAIALGCSMSMAQEIATWSGDRKAAASFTFDDSAPSHVSDVGPAFDSYGFKATFNLVTNWGMDGFQGLADNGHEIASHTNSHNGSGAVYNEEASSKQKINENIKQKYGCITMAYPNCKVPDANAVRQNYIAGRICNGSWDGMGDNMSKDGPSDWTKVPAIMTGDQGTNDFKGEISKVANSGGWVMFVTHGLQGKNNNGYASYSPTPLSAITDGLEYCKNNNIWAAPFGFVAMYVKERKASKVNKKSGDANSITFEVTHSIADNVSKYDYPLTIKIKNDNNWTKVKATQAGADIEASIKDGNILVDAVPNAGDVVVSNADASSTPASSSSIAESSSAATPASSANTPASSADTPKSSNSNPWGPNPWGQQSSSSTTAIAGIEYEASVAVYNENGYITVRDAQGLSITVFNSLGHKVRETRGLGCEQKVYTGAKGMYIVKVGSRVFKTKLQ